MTVLCSVRTLSEKVVVVVPELSTTELSHLGKVDPTDLPPSQVIQVLRCILCQCLGDGAKQSDVSIDEPLRCLGLDSAQSIEFQVSHMYVCMSYVCMYGS